MLKKIFSMIVLFVLIVCSVNNMYVGSRKTEDYNFSKQNKFIVTLPSNPTEMEKRLFPTIKAKLTDNYFHLTDSLKDADVVMIFYCRDSMEIEYIHSTRDFRNLGYTEMDRDTKTHSLIIARAYDAKALREGYMDFIWQANISTDLENVEADPGKAIEYLLNLYGKNKVYSGMYRPGK